MQSALSEKQTKVAFVFLKYEKRLFAGIPVNNVSGGADFVGVADERLVHHLPGAGEWRHDQDAGGLVDLARYELLGNEVHACDQRRGLISAVPSQGEL